MLPLWGDMADDAKHMKRRPVALWQAISGFRLLSTGSGSRWKKKGRQHHADGLRQGKHSTESNLPENSRAASPMPTAPATMATFLLGFRTNQTIAAPVPATTVGSVAAGQGGEVSSSIPAAHRCAAV